MVWNSSLIQNPSILLLAFFFSRKEKFVNNNSNAIGRVERINYGETGIGERGEGERGARALVYIRTFTPCAT